MLKADGVALLPLARAIVPAGDALAAGATAVMPASSTPTVPVTAIPARRRVQKLVECERATVSPPRLMRAERNRTYVVGT
jgi:hypothetical protein